MVVANPFAFIIRHYALWKQNSTKFKIDHYLLSLFSSPLFNHLITNKSKTRKYYKTKDVVVGSR